MKAFAKKGNSFKDWICLESMEFKSDHFKINERYGQGLYIGRIFDTTKFSDEYCKYDEFTGTMVGITCADRVKYKHYADFDFFEYIETAKSDCLE